jgi:formate-dependent nitrite reductase membrane component NrfD
LSQQVERTQPTQIPDGRNIDLSLGVLSGEASGQLVRSEEAAWKHFPRRTEEHGADGTFDSTELTYYDLPVIKKSVWTADIPLYYFTGGLAGAAAVIGAAASLLSKKDDLKQLADFARTLAFSGSIVGSVFLIHDLGRPSRFLFMLRVFRPTSPMNLGTWFFSGFSAAASTTWAASRGWLPKILDKPSYAVAGLFGMALSGYTAVLIANTAVPLWQGAYRTLPFLFVASSAASAGAALEFTTLGERGKRIVEHFAGLAEIAELAAGVALEYEVGRSPRAIRPLKEGITGALWQAARVCTTISLGIWGFSRSTTRSRRTAAVFSLAGALLLKFAIHEGGKKSAEDPRATFDQQRRGLGGMEVSGVASKAEPPGVRSIAAD